MGYDSNTKTLSRPLNTENIRACLGENSLSIKNLACSPLINPKSKYKPMRFTDKNGNAYYPALTEADMLSINYGIVIKAYTFESGDFDSIVGTMGTEIERSLDLTNTSKDEKAFYYDRLVETNEKDIGRMTDFFGYQHLAGDWFTPSFQLKGVVGQANSCRLRLNWGNIVTGFGDLKNWDAYDDLFESGTNNMTACFGFIMKLKGRAWNKFTHFYCILNQEGINHLDEPLIEFMPVSGSAGEWDIYPVLVGGAFGATATANSLHQLNETTSTGTIVPLPYATPEVWKIAQAGGDNESGDNTDLFKLDDYINNTTVAVAGEYLSLDANQISLTSVMLNVESTGDVILNNQTIDDITVSVSSIYIKSDMLGQSEIGLSSSGLNVEHALNKDTSFVVSASIKEEGDSGMRIEYNDIESIKLVVHYNTSYNNPNTSGLIQEYKINFNK